MIEIGQKFFIIFWQFLICFISYYPHWFRSIAKCEFNNFVIFFFAQNYSYGWIFVRLFNILVQCRQIEVHFASVFCFKLSFFQINSYQALKFSIKK